jgi:hypothetical protein
MFSPFVFHSYSSTPKEHARMMDQEIFSPGRNTRSALELRLRADQSVGNRKRNFGARTFTFFGFQTAVA